MKFYGIADKNNITSLLSYPDNIPVLFTDLVLAKETCTSSDMVVEIVMAVKRLKEEDKNDCKT